MPPFYGSPGHRHWQVAHYHVRLIRQLTLYLAPWNLATVTHTMITSRMDFCNSLYVGLPLNLICKLQLVQNAAECLVIA